MFITYFNKILKMIISRNRNILLCIIALLFAACGSDSNSNALRYRNSKYAKFEVYAGAEEGGGRLVNVKMDSTKYFSAVMESFTDAIISFDEDRILVGQISISESSPYKFENESLLIYNSGLWQYFGYGSTSKLAIRQHYVAYKRNNVIQRFRGPSKSDYTLEEALPGTPFSSLSEMLESDTLIVCTRDSYFE